MGSKNHRHYLTKTLNDIRALNRLALNGDASLEHYNLRVKNMLGVVEPAHMPTVMNEARFYMGTPH